MNLSQLSLALSIISYHNVFSCDNKYFKTCPQSGFANLGSSFLFNCTTKVKVKKCIWINPNSLNVYPTYNGEKYFLISNRSCSILISKIDNKDFGQWTCNPELLKDGPAVAGATLLQKKICTANINIFYSAILFTSGMMGTITALLTVFYIKYKNNKTQAAIYI